MDDILIVGAGIAGLAAARLWRQHGARVRVLDKGRGVGGRLATRRVGAAAFDTGAQFFSARTPAFQAEVAQWCAAGICQPWSTGVLELGRGLVTDGLQRYRAPAGMNRIAKLLSADTTVETAVEVVSASVRDGVWELRLNDGSLRSAPVVLMTAPVAQSLTLLRAGVVTLPPEIAQRLEQVRYDPCLAVLADYPQATHAALPSPGGLRCTDSAEPVAWVLSHRAAGMRTLGDGLTVHLRGAWSRQRYPAKDAPDAPILAECWRAVAAALERWCEGDWQNPAHIELKRWKFAHCSAPVPEPHLAAQVAGARVLFAGDAFGDAPRVEGAWLSGVSTGSAYASLASI